MLATTSLPHRRAGMPSSAQKSNIASRPRRQVDISRNTAPPRTIGNQPPAKTLSELENTKARSTARNAPNRASTSGRGQPQRLCATMAANTEVIAIVALTAMP